MEQIKRYFIIFLALCGLIVMVSLVVGREIAKRKFVDSSYCGIIKEKVFKPNRRGFPDVLVDSVWHIFGHHEGNVNFVVEIGDSIVKRSGTSRILLYRKDSSGFWVEVSPDNPYERSK